MKVFQIEERFGLENLRQVERPEPSCKPNYVLVRISAVSLNYRDLMTVKGSYNPRQPLPLIPVSDGVGEVVEVGKEVTRVAVGDRVASIFARDWLAGVPTAQGLRSTMGGPHDGLLTEKIALPEASLVKPPSHLTDVEAATLPCAAVTAWNAVIGLGQLTPGETVVVQGTGGVSIFALQLAKLAGAEVIITSSSDQKLERAKGLGADQIINYREQPDWGKVVAKQGGADLVVEVGGAGTLDQSLKSLRIGGRISLIGILSGSCMELDLPRIFMRQIAIQGILVGCRDDFVAMNRAIEQHQLRPVVDRVFPFDKAVEALRYLESGSHFGKICIEFG